MTYRKIEPLPVTLEECSLRGWDGVDIILVSGDGYIDHPSFGIALIGRLLEDQGYRVAVLPQPRTEDETDFQRFGRPRLFFGISAGNLDSIVANYTGNGKVRDYDAYSPHGNPWYSSVQTRENRRRPDRAVLTYTNLAHRAYPGIKVVLGGVEASLRRFVHFDYKQNKLRGSHLTDAKADLLIYGMAEKSIIQAAEQISSGRDLTGIPSTCIRMSDKEMLSFREQVNDSDFKTSELPAYQAIMKDNEYFMAAELEVDRQARNRSNIILTQKQQAMWVVQYPASPPLSSVEMDHLYTLPFSRKPHPSTPDIPAFSMIKDSITIVRGCSGNCSFCAISRHQGPAVTSRSVESIVNEITSIAANSTFNGTISDLGGPTANLFGTHCAIGSCKKHDCLFPKVCKNLVIDENRFIELLRRVENVDRVKHVYISSGMRMELLRKAPALMRKILQNHTPGALKIAPEHTEKEVLELMHKEPHNQLKAFLEAFNKISQELGRKNRITPYIISAHPGCTKKHTTQMVQKLKKLGLDVNQLQDFTPTPGTLSTAMYVTGVHRDSGRRIQVPCTQGERTIQRKLIERDLSHHKNRRTKQAVGTSRDHGKKNIRNQ